MFKCQRLPDISHHCPTSECKHRRGRHNWRTTCMMPTFWSVRVFASERDWQPTRICNLVPPGGGNCISMYWHWFSRYCRLLLLICYLDLCEWRLNLLEASERRQRLSVFNTDPQLQILLRLCVCSSETRQVSAQNLGEGMS